MTALRSHFLPLNLPEDRWASYFESRAVLVRALHWTIPNPVFSALICRKDQLDGDRRNLRFPINRRLDRPSQTIPASTLTGGAGK